MGGGFYAPETADLVRIREHISATHPELHRLTRAAAVPSRVQGARRGAADASAARIPKDDPAAEYLKHRNFLAGREFPPEFATTREFYPTLRRDVQGR